MRIPDVTHKFVLLLGVFLLPLPAWSQNSATDSQNLRALLEEVRALRRDIATTTVASERVQILLYRLQLQNAAVTRLASRVDAARSRLDNLADQRRRLASQMQAFEDSTNDSQDPTQTQGNEQALQQMKRRAGDLAAEEQTWQTRAADAEDQLRDEKAKLDSLNSQLDQLDQELDNMTTKIGSAPTK